MNKNNLATPPDEPLGAHLLPPLLGRGAGGEVAVMGILNLTPDSFYHKSRLIGEKAIVERAIEMVKEGASILDLGGYSTRPGAAEVSESEEWERLRPALQSVRRELPSVPLSIDTFRAGIARRCMESFGVEMINDISGGEADPEMFRLVADTGVWYVLMHSKGTPQTMQQLAQYDHPTDEVLEWLRQRVERLHALGCNRVVIDPGFGFAKTTEQNYRLMNDLDQFHTLSCPLLVGVSRKSMIWQLLKITPNEAINGTTVLNTVAVMKGAHILRVHDVKEAIEAIKICRMMRH